MADGRVVVAGAGLAGLRTAETLRRLGHTGELVLVGDEQHAPYNRPPLSKAVLTDPPATAPDSLEGLALPHRPDPTLTWRLGVRVEGADLQAGVLRLNDGSDLPYDGLVIATGVRPRRLLPETAGSHVVRTVEDARALAQRLNPRSRVAVVGAGFLGCEIATSAATLGCAVAVVEPASEPLAAHLGPEVGAALRRRHEARGVTFHLGRTVADVRHDDGATVLVLDDGTEVVAEVVAEAVGCRPELTWLEDNGLDLTDGVLCDEGLRVVGTPPTAPPVVAAGDVARFPLPRFGPQPRRIEHWNLAFDTAGLAAHTLLTALGTPPTTAPREPVPSFWSDQAGLRLDSFGIPGLGLDDVRVIEGDLDDDVAVGYHDRAGRMVAVLLLGLRTRVGHYRRVMANGPAEPPTSPATERDAGSLLMSSPGLVSDPGPRSNHPAAPTKESH